MNTYERATFALDELGQWQGVHIPAVRWNGWACPSFTLETVRQIADTLNPMEGNDEFIRIDGDRVFSVYVGNGYEEVEEVNAELVDGVPMFSIGAGGWVWDVVTSTPCTVCGVVSEGRTYEFCEVCDELEVFA